MCVCVSKSLKIISMDWITKLKSARVPVTVGMVGAALLALSGCAHMGVKPVLSLEHHTQRIPLTVDGAGLAQLTDHQPLVGSLDLKPIFALEGFPEVPETTKNLQMLIHFGRFYVTGDGFRSVWEVSPNFGVATGEYRPIPIIPKNSPKPLKNVRLSRYGSAESICVRVDRTGGEAVFIDMEGQVDAICP